MNTIKFNPTAISAKDCSDTEEEIIYSDIDSQGDIYIGDFCYDKILTKK